MEIIFSIYFPCLVMILRRPNEGSATSSTVTDAR
jgi:hypothetical protein